MGGLQRNHLLGLEGVTSEEILFILDTAASFRDININYIEKFTLRGKIVINFFYEPSTRTRISFEVAAKRLNANIISLSASNSSLIKGETLIDTARNLEAMEPNLIIIRHIMSGAPYLLAKYIKTSSIINAGDGIHEHPTQALLDMFTIREKKGYFKNLNISIIGDITHSRVARSSIIGLNTMGANIKIFGPSTLLPPYAKTLGVEVANSMNEAVENTDVIMMLRLQQERLKEEVYIPSLREYAKYFGLSSQHLKLANPDVIIMHPGPINRGVEISSEVADGPYSVILNQVSNGIAVRMALLYLFIGYEEVK